MAKSVFEYRIEGTREDYENIPSELVWILDEVEEKGFDEVLIEVTEGNERGHIITLAIDVFSESEVAVKFK